MHGLGNLSLGFGALKEDIPNPQLRNLAGNDLLKSISAGANHAEFYLGKMRCGLHHVERTFSQQKAPDKQYSRTFSHVFSGWSKETTIYANRQYATRFSL